jgi:type IV pilus assembly protein PilB
MPNESKKKNVLLTFMNSSEKPPSERTKDQASNLLFDSDVPEGAGKSSNLYPQGLVPQGGNAPVGKQGKGEEPQRPAAAQGVSAQTPRLMRVLIENGIVTHDQVKKALDIQQTSSDKRRLLDILVDDLKVDRETIFANVARFYSFESVDPSSAFGDKDKLSFIKQVLQALPQYYYEIAVKRKILPFELYTNGFDKLIVITPDTTHPEVTNVAKAFGFQKYEIKYVSLVDWTELWRQIAFDQGAKQLGLDEDDELIKAGKDEYEKELEKSIEEEAGKGKLSELVENIMIDGVRTGASDIHVIPRSAYRTEFHFRIDGRLSLWSAVTDVRAEAILSVTKDRGKNLDRFEKFLSQDGFGQRTIDNKVVRFRFSTMPIYGTDIKSKLESIVIRILRGAESTQNIQDLGMPEESLGAFLKAIRKPQGMVIFTGPTGSGKTTSQLAAIKTIMDPSLNIITIEDPVEYLIEGCRQVKLNHKLDFEGALRGLLRHDPDVVMVGEMRDKITADIGVKLANTGHLIFSTLHTNDSIGAITRLYNMGIEPFLLAYTINIIIAQRLVRKLCDRCKTPDTELDMDLLMDCKLTEKEISEATFFKPVGCVHCIKGYRGRTGIYETLVMNKALRQIILKSKDFIDEEGLRSAAEQNGMKTLAKSAMQLAREGRTSLECIVGMAVEE